MPSHLARGARLDSVVVVVFTSSRLSQQAMMSEWSIVSILLTHIW
jgi:hypothetical protein